MKVLDTERLTIRRLTVEDAPFILELVNDPAWLQHIGDQNVHDLDDARAYLLRGPIDMYQRHGFGLYAVELKGKGVPIGICGLLKRQGLDDADIGFALLPDYRKEGYAYEAAAAVMAYGTHTLGLPRILAIVLPGNHRSFKLLEKLGLHFDRMVQLAEDQVPVMLFAPASDTQQVALQQAEAEEGKGSAQGAAPDAPS